MESDAQAPNEILGTAKILIAQPHQGRQNQDKGHPERHFPHILQAIIFASHPERVR
jgi:hypothetical protein